MKEIPADIDKAVRTVMDGWHIEDGRRDAFENAVGAVCRVVLAERQKSADIARAFLRNLEGCDLNEDDPETLAHAIIKGELEE